MCVTDDGVRSCHAPRAASEVVACKRTAAALKMGLYLCLLEQDFVRYTIDCCDGCNSTGCCCCDDCDCGK
jgi:hypothetical protein